MLTALKSSSDRPLRYCLPFGFRFCIGLVVSTWAGASATLAVGCHSPRRQSIFAMRTLKVGLPFGLPLLFSPLPNLRINLAAAPSLRPGVIVSAACSSAIRSPLSILVSLCVGYSKSAYVSSGFDLCLHELRDEETTRIGRFAKRSTPSGNILIHLDLFSSLSFRICLDISAAWLVESLDLSQGECHEPGVCNPFSHMSPKG